MISKELEQELVDNGYYYKVDAQKSVGIYSLKSNDMVGGFYFLEGKVVMSLYSQELKQAELIIKLAKEWQSKC